MPSNRLAAALFCIATAGVHADEFQGNQYVIASVNPLATEAGLEMFEAGGNAVDAAVATALTLAVVDGHNSGIGGGCLILVHAADGRLVAVDGRETAPGRATPDMFVVGGIADTEASQTGPLASGVPGALAAYEKIVEKCGTKPMAQLLQPAIELAGEGFAIDERLGAVLEANQDKLRQFDGSRKVYLKKDGGVHTAGDHFVQADLAKVLRQVAAQGSKAFYEGEPARRIDQWMRSNGGLLTLADFKAYRALEREPIVSTYRGYRIVGFPPPSSGGVHVAQSLNMLENFDLAALHRASPARARHLVSEVFARVFADRAYWLGDADFADVPKGLLDKDYANELAKTIDLERAVDVPAHGTPPTWRQDLFGRHTTHVAAADADGNWVAITATINTSFGSGVIVPGTGVVLNNEMDDFSVQPGVPNAFGLIGAENNSIAPGKRPLSSMSPTIVLDSDNEPVLTIGAAGGPKIITQVLLGIVRHLDYGQSLSEAVTTSRYHHQWRPNMIGIEADAPREWAEDFVRRGHVVRTLPSGGVTQAVCRSADGRILGVADPRVPGKVDGR